MVDPKPYKESLANSIIYYSVLKLVKAKTGPKISSLKNKFSGVVS